MYLEFRKLILFVEENDFDLFHAIPVILSSIACQSHRKIIYKWEHVALTNILKHSLEVATATVCQRIIYKLISMETRSCDGKYNSCSSFVGFLMFLSPNKTVEIIYYFFMLNLLLKTEINKLK